MARVTAPAAEPAVHPMSAATFDRLRPGWFSLNRRLGGSFFQTPVWVQSWWEGTGRPTGEIAVWGDADRPDALVGLVKCRRRLRESFPLTVAVWANAGADPGDADHAGWLCPPEMAAAVSDWVLRRIGRIPLELTSVCAAAAAPRLPRARLVGEQVCLAVDLTGDGDRSRTDAKFAKKLAYYCRRLAQEGITTRVLAPGEVTGATLDSLYDLNVARHEAAGATSVLHLEHRAIHDAVLGRSSSDCGAFAVVADSDAGTAGVLYGFWWDKTASYFNSGWSPEAARLSVGSVLIDDALGWTRARGGVRFDFLRGPEPYKYRFGATDHLDGSWFVPRGVGGAAVVGTDWARRTVRRFRHRAV